jgi:hypothetical protein
VWKRIEIDFFAFECISVFREVSLFQVFSDVGHAISNT